MANVTEIARWDAGVYQIEKSDKVLGGADGKVNLQAQQLANRTAYLKQETEKRAPSASPAFTGTPTAPTPAQTVNNTQIATTAFVRTAIAALVGSAPAALDTLAELAQALGADANLKATLLAAIGEKATQADFTALKNLLVGIPFPYPLTAVPSGCLAFNGQAFNKSTYPVLAQKYPSGVLPDLRGEFIRGADMGRGVDSGRGLLSTQRATSIHTPRLVTGYRGTTWSDSIAPTDTDGALPVLEGESLSNGSGTLSFTSDKSSVQVERRTVRPRNVAFQYICLAA